MEAISRLMVISKQYATERSSAPSQRKLDEFTEVYVWGNDEVGQLGLGHKYLKKLDVTGTKVFLYMYM